MDSEQLIALEAQFAPQVERGPSAFSPHEQVRRDIHNLGGDKMAADRNGYAPFYARLISRIAPATVVELGVFRGSSLAVWDAVWPDAQLLGLDLELGRYEQNLPALLGRGAFPGRLPEVRQFDAYRPDAQTVLDVMDGIDLFVDDGPHIGGAISRCLETLGPLVRQAYVVEDFPGGARLLETHLPGWEVWEDGRIAGALRVD